MIGVFDMKLTQKLARDYNKAAKKMAFPPIIVPGYKLDF